MWLKKESKNKKMKHINYLFKFRELKLIKNYLLAFDCLLEKNKINEKAKVNENLL